MQNKKTTRKNKFTMILGAIAAILAISLIAGCTSSGNQSLTSTNAVASNGQVQSIKLSSSEQGVYSPQLIKVKAGTTLRIEGDPKTLVGGMDTIIVDGYKVQKKISPGDNILEFTADKKGEYLVHCANGMGNGKLIVE